MLRHEECLLVEVICYQVGSRGVSVSKIGVLGLDIEYFSVVISAETRVCGGGVDGVFLEGGFFFFRLPIPLPVRWGVNEECIFVG